MDNPMYGISRIDHKNTHSWWVRLWFIKGTPTFQKSFSDKKFGGKTKALASATVYRDKHIVLIPPRRKQLVWKNRSRKIMRTLQKEHGSGVVKVGTGVEAAKKAYDLGMGSVTCYKVKIGKQDYVFVNHGGWHKPEYEDFEFKHDISHKQYKEIRSLVELHANSFSETEKSEMVSDIMIKLSLGLMEDPKRMSGFVKGWVSNRRLRKNKKEVSVDINGEVIESASYMNSYLE